MADQHSSGRPLRMVMGVSCSGKTTTGAERLCLCYADVDVFHSEANVAQMIAGHLWTSAVGEKSRCHSILGIHALAPFRENRWSKLREESVLEPRLDRSPARYTRRN